MKGTHVPFKTRPDVAGKSRFAVDMLQSGRYDVRLTNCAAPGSRQLLLQGCWLVLRRRDGFPLHTHSQAEATPPTPGSEGKQVRFGSSSRKVAAYHAWN